MMSVERSVDTMSGLRSVALAAFLVMTCALLPREAMGLKTTNGSDIDSANVGNVGVGTFAPKYKFDSTSASGSAPKSLLYRRWLHRHTTIRANRSSLGWESPARTGNTLESGVTPVKALHLAELRQAVTWTDSPLKGAIIKAALRAVVL